MLDLFPVPWDELDLENLDGFLRVAQPEPLHWEAKGTQVRPDQVTKAAGAFANSFDGGYLILGATESKREKRSSQWTLDGAAFSEEPALWVSKVIDAGLRPRPAFQIRTLECADERHVVIVWVPPVDVSPCVVGGTVYERLPGQSVPVKDPQRLADLYGRGQAAVKSAQSAADSRSEHLLDELLEGAHEDMGRTSSAGAAGMAFNLPRTFTEVGRGGNLMRVSVGLRPVSLAGDPASHLFTVSFAKAMQQALVTSIGKEGPVTAQPGLGQSQTTMWSNISGSWNSQWRLKAWADGSVGAIFEEREENGHASGLRDRLYDAWALADQFARRLGGGPEHYMVARITGVLHLSRSAGMRRVPVIQRGLIRLPERDSAEFHHVYRELQRIGGEFAWEPERSQTIDL